LEKLLLTCRALRVYKALHLKFVFNFIFEMEKKNGQP